MKEYDFNNHVGCVIQRRSRQTGLLYGVYHGVRSDLDVNAKRITLCEKHSTTAPSDALNSAKQITTSPVDWCEKCRQKYA